MPAASYAGMLTAIATSAYRFIMVFTSVIISIALGYVPILGPFIEFVFFCWINSYVPAFLYNDVDPLDANVFNGFIKILLFRVCEYLNRVYKTSIIIADALYKVCLDNQGSVIVPAHKIP